MPKPPKPAVLPQRSGARSRAAIPPAVLAALNVGTDETRSLPETLAVDQVTLARVVLPAVLGVKLAKSAVAAAEASAALGIMQRFRAIGRALVEVPPAKLAPLAHHRSDVVRCWACIAVLAKSERSLAQRLADAKPFAADAHFGVRELAWMEMRPHLAEDLPAAFALLASWVTDADAHVRRCACEATRPRGVWCAHLPALIRDPRPAEPLLEGLRADPARYVQLSVGNWLNDAGKSNPEWLRALSARWLRESPVPATTVIVRRGCRRLAAD